MLIANAPTTQFGALVPDNQNSFDRSARAGLLLAQDLWLNEVAGQLRARVIPERRMHAKGLAPTAPTVTHDITKYTRAAISCRGQRRSEMRPLHHGGRRTRRRPTPSATSGAASPSSF